MTRNRFMTWKSMTHFCDNDYFESNKSDRAYKVLPLITAIQESFKKFGIFEKDLSIDEMIVKYYGHNSLKQFIKGKPIRFGYKFWTMCGNSGHCYNFDMYCGKSRDGEMNDYLTSGSRVVIKMTNMVENPLSHSNFFDNLFTSYDLLVHLREKGFEATGTRRGNRLKKFPLPESKILKKEVRGTCVYRFDDRNKILIVKWVDHKCVTIGANYDKVEPSYNVQRWSKGAKLKASVRRAT